MTKKRIYRIVQAALCALLAALLCAGAVGIYADGVRARGAGDATAWIYTREKAAERLAPIASLALLTLAAAIVGRMLGVQEARMPAGIVNSQGLKRAAQAGPGRSVRLLRAALLLAAAVFIILGAYNGGARDVLYKAINICTECVGLG